MSAKKRKQKINYKGRTAQEERELEKEFTFSQSETAKILGVDPRTIQRWCQAGLMHKRGAPGKEKTIEMRTVLHWCVGHKYATDKNIDLSSLEKLIFGLALGFIGGKENPSFSTWRLQMIRETDWFDATQQQITFAIGRLSGLGCLPFRQSRW